MWKLHSLVCSAKIWRLVYVEKPSFISAGWLALRHGADDKRRLDMSTQCVPWMAIHNGKDLKCHS